MPGLFDDFYKDYLKDNPFGDNSIFGERYREKSNETQQMKAKVMGLESRDGVPTKFYLQNQNQDHQLYRGGIEDGGMIYENSYCGAYYWFSIPKAGYQLLRKFSNGGDTRLEHVKNYATKEYSSISLMLDGSQYLGVFGGLTFHGCIINGKFVDFRSLTIEDLKDINLSNIRLCVFVEIDKGYIQDAIKGAFVGVEALAHEMTIHVESKIKELVKLQSLILNNKIKDKQYFLTSGKKVANSGHLKSKEHSKGGHADHAKWLNMKTPYYDRWLNDAMIIRKQDAHLPIPTNLISDIKESHNVTLQGYLGDSKLMEHMKTAGLQVKRKPI